MSDSLFEKYNVAEEHYKKAVGTVTEMAEILMERVEGLTVDSAIAQYDVIVQAALISSAVADGDLLDEEIRFITQITDKGDLLCGLNNKIADEGLDFEEITLEGLAEVIKTAPEEYCNRLVAFLAALAEEFSESFIDYFAVLDAIHQRDFLEEIYNETLCVIMAFCECDGDSMQDYNADDGVTTTIECEVDAGVALLKRIFSDKWLARIEDFEEYRRSQTGDQGTPDGESDTDDGDAPSDDE